MVLDLPIARYALGRWTNALRWQSVVPWTVEEVAITVPDGLDRSRLKVSSDSWKLSSDVRIAVVSVEEGSQYYFASAMKSYDLAPGGTTHISVVGMVGSCCQFGMWMVTKADEKITVFIILVPLVCLLYTNPFFQIWHQITFFSFANDARSASHFLAQRHLCSQEIHCV